MDVDGFIKEIREKISRYEITEDFPKLKKKSAVLIILKNQKELKVIFTKRTNKVAYHKGEISFPGGLWEKGDKNLLDTALRETKEELGIPPEDLDVIGAISPIYTLVTNFSIYPYVAYLKKNYFFSISKDEIEKVIEVPLTYLLNPTEYREDVWEYEGKKIPMYYFTYNKDIIWGATARILKKFLKTIKNEES
jgi:8-oxo-dGTP pyrophosphatase MutT (NUDIX family)